MREKDKQRETETERDRERQTERQTDRQADRRTGVARLTCSFIGHLITVLMSIFGYSIHTTPAEFMYYFICRLTFRTKKNCTGTWSLFIQEGGECELVLKKSDFLKVGHHCPKRCCCLFKTCLKWKSWGRQLELAVQRQEPRSINCGMYLEQIRLTVAAGLLTGGGVSID